MPASFPEVWLKRVIMLFTSLTAAPWLDGIPDLDVEVLEMGSGTASEMNVIHIPVEDFEVDVLLNNTTYPIPLQAHTDTEVIVKLDKWQTKVTTLSDDQIDGAAYPKIDSATKSHTRSMLTNKFKKAIHALAPNENTANTPILETTGALVGTRRRLIYEDLVAAKDKLDAMDAPEEGRRLVLCKDHYNDMLLDKARFANLLVDYKAGTVAPIIAGFEIYSYLGNPYFLLNGDEEWEKVPYGSVVDPAARKGSVFFLRDNVAKKTGKTKQYFAKSDQDPENQTNRLNYRHYFIAVPFKLKYEGAIVSGGANTPAAAIPTVTSVTPSTVENGDEITITGTNFTGASSVEFDSTPATYISVVSDTTITAIVPTLADDSYDVTVITSAGVSEEVVSITVDNA